ncbi:MAG: hypothetical protein C0498_03050 [Anaerolinea sp.]|jgi:hypothetical protein|nr:hypothetical protein [Anaerolinea sp.]
MAIVLHFLLVYDHKRQQLASKPRQFTDGARAASAYSEYEAEHRNDANLEIVLVGADSLSTIMRTHGHYFKAAEEPFPSLLQPAGDAAPVRA